MRKMLANLVVIAVLGLTALPARAEDEVKVPYWASLRSDEVNMRAGPGEEYRISWVYHRKQLPLKVLRTMEGWRLIQDPDGARGWMLARFLTRARGGFITKGPPAEMRDEPGGQGKLLWRLAPGVSGALGDCAEGWCRFETAGHAGHVRQDRIWGAGEP